MTNFNFETYLSPFTFRYGSKEMRNIWSEINKRKLWRKIWVALAKTQFENGLVSKEELDDLIKYQNEIDIEKSHEIEKEIKHDLMAEIKTYEEKAKIGGGKIHLGATSMDIEDNADAIRIKESIIIIEQKLNELIKTFGEKIKLYKDTVCMGYTHLQPAEPTTLGYRFAFYAQDLLMDLRLLYFAKTMLKGKGFKGAVGTSASYSLLLDDPLEMEEKTLKKLGIDSVLIANQTAPRKIEYFVSMALSSIAQSLYKFAFDVRIMQSPGFSEWQEPFSEKQVGSSAMPFKRNPIKSEQICSLARVIFNLSNIARENASNMLLERTLDDSANRRVYLPEIFLATDNILTSSINIVKNLVINFDRIEKNLLLHGPFSATEAILMTAVKNGGNRQEIHEALREDAMKAYEKIKTSNETNPLKNILENDKRITNYVDKEKINTLLNPKAHVGIASKRCDMLLLEIA